MKFFSKTWVAMLVLVTCISSSIAIGQSRKYEYIASEQVSTTELPGDTVTDSDSTVIEWNNDGDIISFPTVYDYAGVLNQEVIATVYDYNMVWYKKYGFAVGLVTVYSANGAEISQFSQDIIDDTGAFTTNDGAIIITMDDRNVYMDLQGTAYDVLYNNDGRDIKDIIQDKLEDVEDADDYDKISSAVKKAYKKLDKYFEDNAPLVAKGGGSAVVAYDSDYFNNLVDEILDGVEKGTDIAVRSGKGIVNTVLGGVSSVFAFVMRLGFFGMAILGFIIWAAVSGSKKKGQNERTASKSSYQKVYPGGSGNTTNKNTSSDGRKTVEVQYSNANGTTAANSVNENQNTSGSYTYKKDNPGNNYSERRSYESRTYDNEERLRRRHEREQRRAERANNRTAQSQMQSQTQQGNVNKNYNSGEYEDVDYVDVEYVDVKDTIVPEAQGASAAKPVATGLELSVFGNTSENSSTTETMK